MIQKYGQISPYWLVLQNVEIKLSCIQRFICAIDYLWNIDLRKSKAPSPSLEHTKSLETAMTEVHIYSQTT